MDAVPNASLEWYHNGVILKPKPRYEIEVNSETGECSLQITQIKQQDTGTYELFAENEAGRISTSCYIYFKSNTPTASVSDS